MECNNALDDGMMGDTIQGYRPVVSSTTTSRTTPMSASQNKNSLKGPTIPANDRKNEHVHPHTHLYNVSQKTNESNDVQMAQTSCQDNGLWQGLRDAALALGWTAGDLHCPESDQPKPGQWMGRVKTNQEEPLADVVSQPLWIFNSSSPAARAALDTDGGEVVLIDAVRSDTGFWGQLEHVPSVPLGYLNSSRQASKILEMALITYDAGYHLDNVWAGHYPDHGAHWTAQKPVRIPYQTTPR